MFDVQGMKADAAKAAKEAMCAFGDSAFDHMLPLLNGQDVFIDGSTGGRYVGVLKIVDGKLYVATDKGNLEASAWGALCAVQSAFTAPRDLIKLSANGMSISQALHAMGGRTSWSMDSYATEEIFTKGLGCSNVQRSKGMSPEEFAKVSLPTLGPPRPQNTCRYDLGFCTARLVIRCRTDWERRQANRLPLTAMTKQ